MSTLDLLQNFLNTPVLYFFLGMAAIAMKSNLEIPQPIPKFFSLYLLFSIGIRGGAELSKSGFDHHILSICLVAVLMSALVPLYAFILFKRKTTIANAAALAATYGSVSAVTFITATAFLQSNNVTFGGHMVAVMALMETPAIIVAVVLYKLSSKEGKGPSSLGHVIKEAFTEGSIVILLGSLLIGLVVGEKGFEPLKPFAGDMFKGLLCLFLLDMGLVAARSIKDLKAIGASSLLFAVALPLINASAAMVLAKILGVSRGDAFMFTVLCASASYIAVPAAMRVAIPQSNPGVFVPMSMAVTFPFNILVGIPIYYFLITQLIG